MVKIIYRDKAGNTLRFEKKKLLARNTKGKLVNLSGLKTLARKAGYRLTKRR